MFNSASATFVMEGTGGGKRTFVFLNTHGWVGCYQPYGKVIARQNRVLDLDI